MSLIEEALRRVQTLPPPPGRPETIPQTPERRVAPPMLPRERPVSTVTLRRQRPASRIPWRGVVIGATGVLLLGWGVWATKGVLRATSRPRQTMTVTRPGPAPSSRRGFIPLPTRPDLALSGVVPGPGEPMALINGSVLKPGDTIEGATLLDVTDDSARLRWRDEELVLHLAR